MQTAWKNNAYDRSPCHASDLDAAANINRETSNQANSILGDSFATLVSAYVTVQHYVFVCVELCDTIRESVQISQAMMHAVY